MIFETNREGTINGKQGLAGEELQLGTAVGLEAEATGSIRVNFANTRGLLEKGQ